MSRFRMCRWHKNCDDPDFEVIIEGGHNIPRCRSCRASPPIEAFIDQLAQKWRPNPIPSDETIGSMNLYWPASVFPDQNVLPSFRTTPAESNRNVEVNVNGQKQEFQMVDEEQLNSSTLRLMRLSSATDDDPVCVSLQICTDDNLPEYEALSYSLGGNSRRTNPNKPVYIGEHRDVMILTETCESMLRYLSPHPGEQAKLVWFDYLCINQNDMIERDYQLPKMRSIYSGCTRVIVYLGGEMVDRLGPGQHRPRRWLHEIDETFGSHNLPITMESVFQNNYFQRTWVIQEILLAETIVIPIRNYDFRAGLVALNRLEKVRTLNWNQTSASWLSRMGQTTIYGGNLYEALRQTWTSGVTDRRDKIFGILGLVDDSNFNANSSLSWISVLIGTWAHLIKRGHTYLLLNSMGSAAPADQLSWLPHVPKDSPDSVIWDQGENRWSQDMEKLRDQYPISYLYYETTLHEGKVRQPSQETMKIDRMRVRGPGTYVVDVLCMDDGYYPNPLPPLDQFSIHNSTGALCLDMGHLVTVPRQGIRMMAEERNMKAFEIRQDQSFLIITTMNGPLETLQPSDDIFLRHNEYNKRGMIFALRRRGQDGPYRLIFTCVCVDALLFTESTSLRNDYKKGIPTSPNIGPDPTGEIKYGKLLLDDRFTWYRPIFARNVSSLRDECNLIDMVHRNFGDPYYEQATTLYPRHPFAKTGALNGFRTERFLQQWNILPDTPDQSYPQFEWSCNQEVVDALGLQGQVKSVEIQ